MEIREFAERVFFAQTLEEKLLDVSHVLLSDRDPGQSLDWQEPGRPVFLRPAGRTKGKRLPSAEAMAQVEHRIRVLHTFANHELMAIELMAWALLFFPDAPVGFRRGVLSILEDEQRHFQWLSLIHI